MTADAKVILAPPISIDQTESLPPAALLWIAACAGMYAGTRRGTVDPGPARCTSRPGQVIALISADLFTSGLGNPATNPGR